MTQWVAGFGRTMRDESDPDVRQHMLECLIALMDDANDFSWTSAKASHTVLLCWMEQGEVKDFSDFFAIERIWRANAQKHVQPSANISGSKKNFQKSQNLCPAHILIRILVCKPNPMRQGVYSTSTSVLLALQTMARCSHMQRSIVKAKISPYQKTNSKG